MKICYFLLFSIFFIKVFGDDVTVIGNFENVNYVFVANPMYNYTDANLYCKNISSSHTLAKIPNERARDFVLINLGINVQDVYIGCDEIDSFGYWTWQDGTDCGPGSPNFTNWNPGEPNLNSQACTQMRSSQGGRWADVWCDSVSRFLCSGDVPTTSPSTSPSRSPTTATPTSAQTASPTYTPTESPTRKPTNSPTDFVDPYTDQPPDVDTDAPTKNPTISPTPPTSFPSKNPTFENTASPTAPTESPTINFGIQSTPTSAPTLNPNPPMTEATKSTIIFLSSLFAAAITMMICYASCAPHK